NHSEITLEITSLALANLPIRIQPAASKVTAILSISRSNVCRASAKGSLYLVNICYNIYTSIYIRRKIF
ncbi:MAG: hypothetical protein IJ671_06430, partial [Succinivibrio sp.]|nr:hypothetical protein [Succinivibrio sp.]